MKKTSARIALLALFVGGCGHAKKTDAEEPKQATEKTEEKTEQKTSEPRRVKEKQDPAAVPVASSPEGLLAPGAEEQIREKLAAGDYLKGGSGAKSGSTREGIRRFQEANDLPATGAPDHTTVRKLGLDPDQVFRQQTVKD
jgi:pyruvate/2-oxoglutarate dehydrogenase complex dihydrolipoamide acyltransferase (E2) component